MRTLAATAFVVALTAGLLETASRVFWRVGFAVPMTQPDQILGAWYPGLLRVKRQQPSRQDKRFDILLLGGSVVNNKWGNIENELVRQFSSLGYKRVRVFNFGVPGHTSRDSLIKYRAMHQARFDLVLLYHGINEIRANNVPPDLYRQRYGHYGWYELVNSMEQHQDRATWALPLTLDYLRVRIAQTAGAANYVPEHIPREEWFQYGETQQSVAEFDQNIRTILDIARSREDPLVLMSFAWYLADGYDLDAFMAGQLAYGEHRAPIEMWGRPEHVVATLQAHNRVVRTIAAENGSVVFVDQASALPGNADYFDDICHLTERGSQAFVENIVTAFSSLP